MQGIFCLILLPACFELSTARPRLAGVMVKAWPRSGPHQAGGFSPALDDNGGHLSLNNPTSLPCFPELRCPEVMNPELAASASDTQAKTFHAKDTKTFIRDKTLRGVHDFWSLLTRTSKNIPHTSKHQVSRMPSQDHRRAPVNTPKKIMWERWKRHPSRTKRSVMLGTEVRYSGSEGIMIRRKNPDHALFLRPDPTSNTLTLGNSTCFRAHFFQEDVANIMGGYLVVLEAHNDSYIHGSSTGYLSLMTSEAGMATVTHIDNRFFRLKTYIGDADIRLKHIGTGMHIQATSTSVSLNSSDPLGNEDMRFYDYSCTIT